MPTATEDTKAKARAANRAWKAKNPDKVRAATARWREKNREKHRASQRAWRAKNPNAQKAWREKNPGAQKAWREKNRDKVAAYQKRWVAEHIEHLRAYQRDYWFKRTGSRPSSAVAPIHAEALAADPIWSAANAVVPRSLPHDVRADVVSMICLAVLEGEIALADVPRLGRSFISRHYRQFSKFDTVSLDAPIWSDSGKTLLDTLTTDHTF